MIYAAVACGNNNQAQFTHVSVSYRRLTRPRVALRYSARTSSYFKQRTSLLRVSSDNNYVRYECINYRKWAWQSKNFRVHFVRPWLNPLSKFLDPPLEHTAHCSNSLTALCNGLSLVKSITH